MSQIVNQIEVAGGDGAENPVSTTTEITRTAHEDAAWMEAKRTASDLYTRRSEEMDAGAWAGYEEQAFGLEEAGAFGLEEDEPFGWMPRVDPVTNRWYYEHSHTGEVRWTLEHEQEGPRTNPWATTEEEDISSPFYQEFVSLPSGITPSHPRAISLESWRGGYKTFPMLGAGGELNDNPASDDNDEVQRRVLPCTWEMSPHGSPFLSPFPVVIIQPVIMQEPTQPNPEVATPMQDQWWNPHPSTIERSASLHQLQLAPAFIPQAYAPPESAQGYFSCATLAPYCEEYHAPPSPALPAPLQPFKEHNRRGYNMRQARKLMKQLSLQSQSVNPPIPHSPHQVPIATSLHNPLQDQSSAIRVN